MSRKRRASTDDVAVVAREMLLVVRWNSCFKL
jgi:hypothetical protein